MSETTNWKLKEIEVYYDLVNEWKKFGYKDSIDITDGDDIRILEYNIFDIEERAEEKLGYCKSAERLILKLMDYTEDEIKTINYTRDNY